MSDAYDFPVDRTAILAFAGALGETNGIYYDERYAAGTALGGVIAPPTFATASNLWNPSYYLRGVRRIPEPSSASDSQAPEVAAADAASLRTLGRWLHAEMRYDYHQPIRPGMRLRVTTRPGKSWEKTGRRGGRLRFEETIIEYRDERNEPVVTACSVSVFTSRSVESGP